MAAKKLCVEDKTFFVTTLTSMLAILKVRFTDAEIKKLVNKKSINEILLILEEIEMS